MAEQSIVKTSPSRLAVITNKIVSLVSSPLRYAVNDHLSLTLQDVEVDEEISLRGRSQSSGGLVCANTSEDRLQSPLGVSNDRFFTPIASEDVLAKACNNLGGNNLSNESVPEGFSRSFSIGDNSPKRTMGGLNEFDPIGLIVFDSPQRQVALTTHGPASPPKNSLLDLEPPYPSSPNSAPKYSERDFQLLRQQFEERLEKQTEFLQFEILTLQEKYTQSLRAGEEMKLLLEEYERNIRNLVETRKIDPDKMTTWEQAGQERQKLLIETQALRISFSNLKMLYDENKLALDSLRLSEHNLLGTVSQLKKELSESQKNYEALLSHAQSRMNDANEELHRLKTTLEIELSATKAKLHKSGLRVSSLESIVESKTRENSELMTICDELIQKIDSQALAAGNPKSAAILSSLSLNRSGSQ